MPNQYTPKEYIDRDLLWQLYEVNHCSGPQMARMLGTTTPIIYRNMRECNITRRPSVPPSQKGTQPSDATKLKISLKHKGRIKSPEWRKHLSAALKGKKFSDEHREHLKQSHLGNPCPEETKAKLRGRTLSKKRKTQLSMSSLALWENPEYIKHVTQGWARRPNRAELVLEDILNKNFPQFKYNGNYNLGISLNRMIPDFVNTDGKKEIIEVFGDYFHRRNCPWKRSELGRIMAYNSMGYHCLIIWASELKKLSEEDIIAKISKWRKRK